MERPRHFEELDYVQPTLAALELRDVGLGALELFGEYRLGQTRLFSCLNEELAEACVSGCKDGFGQTGTDPATQGSNSLKPILG